jgi:hypothetical protein
MSAELEALLSEALDLCVRARKLEDDTEKALRVGYSKKYQFQCGTPALWVLEQYDNDLKAWEAKARAALTRITNGRGVPKP